MLDLTNKTRDQLINLAEATEALKERYRYNYRDFLFPETGKYSRAAYKGAMEFFASGETHGLRMLGGCNGSGKSFTGAYELMLHLTGDYPDWWEGKKQECPKHWWVVSESAGTFKSSLQRLLLGDTLDEENLGTGLIPKHKIEKISGWQNVPGAVSAFYIRHRLGHIVTVEVKTSDQNRQNLQGANLDGVLFDEEPPLDTYTECIMRLRGSPKKPPGISMLLFTPLLGLSEVVLKYLVNGQYPENGVHPLDPDKYVVRIDYMDVPHLSEQDRLRMENEATPADRCARLHGLPAIGAGRIWPIEERFVVVPQFKIPSFWKKAYGFDPGWQATAALWVAEDPDSKVRYIYSEYKRGQQIPVVHAEAIKLRGEWINGSIDCHGAKHVNEKGITFLNLYENVGLHLVESQGEWHAGIASILAQFESGALKIMSNCQELLNEIRVYRYDPKDPNKPAKNQQDHLCDTLRYVDSRFDEIAESYIDVQEQNDSENSSLRSDQGRNPYTGY